jgi:outer membrane protein assembly factor BamB
MGHNRIFLNGMPDTLGVLYSFDMEGNLLWEKVYGTEWHKNYTGTRSTPVVAGDLVYLESGMDVVYCMDAFSGDMVWEVDLLEKFDAENIQWGMTESLLIDGNNIICTPGGEEYNVVALNRFTGETVWTSALVKIDRNSFEIKGRFEVPLGTDQHWAHPVIKDKRLYLRHGDALMVYDISVG